MLVKIHPENPDKRKVAQVVDCLRSGGVIIYPTDTIYGVGCNIFKPKAVEKICKMKGVKPGKVHLSFICSDLSHLSDYTLNFDKTVYRLMNKNLPGPFTFILPASRLVPKLFKSNKKTVGIRVPDNEIARAIVDGLENPIMSTSLKRDDDVNEFPTDPEEIYEEYGKLVDMVVDGGPGSHKASTVVDCTQSEVVILRQGAGELEF